MAAPKEDFKFVTNEFLTDILRRRYESNDELRVIDFAIRRLRPVEEEFITKVRGVTATVLEANGNRQYSMILKTVIQSGDCHMDDEREKELMIFEKEELSYKKMIPAMEKIVKEQGAFISVPVPFLMHSESQGIKFLLFEDLSLQGFFVTKFDDKFDYEHCKLAVEGIATFHALSLVLGKGSVENLRNDFEALFVERVAPGPFMDIFEKAARFNLDVCLNVVRRSTTDKEILNEIEKLQSMEVSGMYERAFAPDPIFNVVCHRDFKPGNMLFKYDNSEEKNKVVTDFKFIDLQLATVGSPALDLVMMLYTSTTEMFRRQHLNKILQDYYAKFVSVLNMADVPVPDCFTYGLLLQHFQERAGLGIIFSWVTYVMFSKAVSRNSLQAAEQYDLEAFDEICEDIIKAGDDVDILDTFCAAVKEHYFDHL